MAITTTNIISNDPSLLIGEGVGAFERITAELKAIMEEKGYQSLEDFRGKLHYID